MELLDPYTKEMIVRLMLTAWGAGTAAILVGFFVQAVVIDLRRARRDWFWPPYIAAAVAFVSVAIPIWGALGGW